MAITNGAGQGPATFLIAINLSWSKMHQIGQTTNDSFEKFRILGWPVFFVISLKVGLVIFTKKINKFSSFLERFHNLEKYRIKRFSDNFNKTDRSTRCD